uniref:sphingosine kinase n=1 Tax=Ficedula albicollis TaxID=59894 RepID=A0A803V4K1_FICAL
METGDSYGVLPRPCHALVLLNPQSGSGRALDDFQAVVQPMLAEADIATTVFVTERPHHAHEKVRDEDLSQWDTLVVMSGDGLLFEVVNGLMERPDWKEAMKKPLCILPGGSGNALAASINYYAGYDHVAKKKLLTNCTFILCKGLYTQMDLVSLSTASGKHFFSFLGFGWGFISDVDIDSEKYRWLGSARFTLGTLQCLAKLRVYQGRLSYLPVAAEQGSSPEPRDPRAPLTNGHIPQAAGTGAPGSLPPDSLLAPLGQPVPAHWTVVPEEEFVLVYAIYQSHLGTNLLMAPAARLHDGVIHLFYMKAGISRVTLLKLFLAMSRGTHLDLNCPHLCYVPVRAFRLEPRGAAGIMTVDGGGGGAGAAGGRGHHDRGWGGAGLRARAGPGPCPPLPRPQRLLSSPLALPAALSCRHGPARGWQSLPPTQEPPPSIAIGLGGSVGLIPSLAPTLSFTPLGQPALFQT